MEKRLAGLPKELEGLTVSGEINPAIVDSIRNGAKTLDDLAFGIGLSNLCRFFNWQGGTIHQAKTALKWYLMTLGIFEGKDGTIGTFTFGR